MFADEARFGRMNRPRPCWAPTGVRPEVAAQLIREYIYLYGAVCPKDGKCVYLIMPASDTACFQIYLDVLSRKYRRQHILLVLDGVEPEGEPLGRNPRKDIQEPRPQIHERRACKTQGGSSLHRAQSRNRQIHHSLPLHCQVNLIWRRYNKSFFQLVRAKRTLPKYRHSARGQRRRFGDVHATSV